MTNFFDKFSISREKEDLQTVITNIDNGVVFRGTNLWILIFAIFVASLGLNVNSTAVIIGAMLISPLMGPIMGIGLGMGINDIVLLRKSIYNFAVASGVALVTSTIFFLLSPLDDAHSEILARTTPTIYDVLIAFFGGLAGIIATSSKQKGNVIPGVAIATALMPPLCTAGYGLATLQLGFFLGAIYLFIINTVFIALATFIIVRVLQFPYKHLQTPKAEAVARRIVWVVVMLTLLPSIYLGYDLVQQDRFTKKVNDFINNEAHFPNDYLLNKKIDAKNRNFTLVYGGKEITAPEIEALKMQLKKYQLDTNALELKQGFAYLNESNNLNKELDAQHSQLSKALELKDIQEKKLQAQLDSIGLQQKLSAKVYSELKALYPTLKNAVIQPTIVLGENTGKKPTFLILLSISANLSGKQKSTISQWLKVRLGEDNINLIFQK